MSISKHLTVAAIVATLASTATSAQEIARTVKDGVYATAQAQRGRELMAHTCAECHADEEFTEGLIDSWTGATVADLFDQIRSTMPEDNPGSLEPGQYADALAYIFQLNGLPAGQTELDTRMDRLATILIEKDE